MNSNFQSFVWWMLAAILVIQVVGMSLRGFEHQRIMERLDAGPTCNVNYEPGGNVACND